jgi:transposase
VEPRQARRRPYKTGELARLFGVSQKTAIRWIEEGRFGAENRGWRWTPGGPGKGDREVLASAVRKYSEAASRHNS